MPYGFGGGLAEGFNTGVSLGQNQQEIKLRREALLKEQINAQIERVSAIVGQQLKAIEATVTGAAQRVPAVDQAVEAQKGQIMDGIAMIAGLGTPEAQQTAQALQQQVNAVIPTFKTQSEANTAKNLGEAAGALDAAKQMPTIIAGGQPTMPTAAPVTPTTPGVQLNNDPNARLPEAPLTPMPGAPEAIAPEAPAQVAQAAPAGQPPAGNTLTPDQEEWFKRFLGDKAGEGEKLAAGSEGRLAILQSGIEGLDLPVNDEGLKARDLLSKPSTWKAGQAIGLPGRMVGTELQRAQDQALKVARGAFYALTGAAAPDTESKQLFSLFIPSYLNDDDKSAAMKMKGLYDFAGRAMEFYRTKRGNFMSREEAMMTAGLPFDEVYGDTAIAAPNGADMGSSATAAPAVPEVGAIEDGYRFKGGNPADPNSWEKVE